jgi:hypothetical protein
MKPLTDQDVRAVRLSKAIRYTRRHVYYRMSKAGAYLPVESIEKWGRDLRVTLVNGKCFVVGRDTPFFARKGHAKVAP